MSGTAAGSAAPLVLELGARIVRVHHARGTRHAVDPATALQAPGG